MKNLKLKHLGSQTTTYKTDYDPNLLETFANPHPASFGWTTLICPEFTSLCPKTGQPDFARIFINYIASARMVESKSLKLYLFSFRNHGGFHEDCVHTICQDLVRLMQPHYIEVSGHFTPRGGIAIFPTASFAGKGARWQKLRDDRLRDYRPGSWGMNLGRLYS